MKLPAGSSRVALTAFVVMVAGMIATPLFGTGGDERRVLAHVVVASFFVAAIASAQQAFGSGALVAAAMIVIFTFLVEVLGSTTGFPFGAYDYTDSLVPQLFGVPVIVSFAWAGITLVVHGALGPRVAAPPADGGSTAVSKMARIVMMACAITAWDLFLDPQMVGEGYWRWEPVSFAYREIPLVNYGGWLLTASVTSAIALAMCKPAAVRAAASDSQLVRTHAVFSRAVYATLASLSTIGFLFFFDDALVAVVGGVGTGAFVVASYVTRPRT
jgi:putative membrane protein